MELWFNCSRLLGRKIYNLQENVKNKITFVQLIAQQHQGKNENYKR